MAESTVRNLINDALSEEERKRREAAEEAALELLGNRGALDTIAVSKAESNDLTENEGLIKDLSKDSYNVLRVKYGQKVADQAYNLQQSRDKLHVTKKEDPGLLENTANVGLDIAKGATNVAGSVATSLFNAPAFDGLGNPFSGPVQALPFIENAIGAKDRPVSSLLDEAAVATAKGTKFVTDYIESFKSDFAKKNAYYAGIQQNLDSQDNWDQAAKEIEEGESPNMAAMKAVGRNLADSLENITEDPEQARTTVANAAGSLLVSVPLARGGAKGAGGLAKSLGAGKKIQNAARFAGGLVSIGATEAAGANQETITSIMGMPEEELASSPLYKALQEQEGYTPEEARTEIATLAGRNAFWRNLPAATVLGLISYRFNIAPTSVFKHGIVQGMGSVVKETIEEGSQEAVAALSGNIAKKELGLDVKVGEHVGEGAAQGIVGGFGQAAIVGAPSMSLETLKLLDFQARANRKRAVESSRQATELDVEGTPIPNIDTPSKGYANVYNPDNVLETFSGILRNNSKSQFHMTEEDAVYGSLVIDAVSKIAATITDPDTRTKYLDLLDSHPVRMIQATARAVNQDNKGYDENTEITDDLAHVTKNIVKTNPMNVNATIADKVADRLESSLTGITLAEEADAIKTDVKLLRAAAEMKRMMNDYLDAQLEVVEEDGKTTLSRGEKGPTGRGESASTVSESLLVGGFSHHTQGLLPSANHLMRRIFLSEQGDHDTFVDTETSDNGRTRDGRNAAQNWADLIEHENNKLDAFNESHDDQYISEETGKSVGHRKKFRGLMHGPSGTWIEKDSYKNLIKPVHFDKSNPENIAMAERVESDTRLLESMFKRMRTLLPDAFEGIVLVKPVTLKHDRDAVIDDSPVTPETISPSTADEVSIEDAFPEETKDDSQEIDGALLESSEETESIEDAFPEEVVEEATEGPVEEATEEVVEESVEAKREKAREVSERNASLTAEERTRKTQQEHRAKALKKIKEGKKQGEESRSAFQQRLASAIRGRERIVNKIKELEEWYAALAEPTAAKTMYYLRKLDEFKEDLKSKEIVIQENEQTIDEISDLMESLKNPVKEAYTDGLVDDAESVDKSIEISFPIEESVEDAFPQDEAEITEEEFDQALENVLPEITEDESIDDAFPDSDETQTETKEEVKTRLKNNTYAVIAEDVDSDTQDLVGAIEGFLAEPDRNYTLDEADPDFLVVWAPEGNVSDKAAKAIESAEKAGINIYNLADLTQEEITELAPKLAKEAPTQAELLAQEAEELRDDTLEYTGPYVEDHGDDPSNEIVHDLDEGKDGPQTESVPSRKKGRKALEIIARSNLKHTIEKENRIETQRQVEEQTRGIENKKEREKEEIRLRKEILSKLNATLEADIEARLEEGIAQAEKDIATEESYQHEAELYDEGESAPKDKLTRIVELLAPEGAVDTRNVEAIAADIQRDIKKLKSRYEPILANLTVEELQIEDENDSAAQRAIKDLYLAKLALQGQITLVLQAREGTLQDQLDTWIDLLPNGIPRNALINAENKLNDLLESDLTYDKAVEKVREDVERIIHNQLVELRNKYNDNKDHLNAAYSHFRNELREGIEKDARRRKVSESVHTHFVEKNTRGHPRTLKDYLNRILGTEINPYTVSAVLSLIPDLKRVMNERLGIVDKLYEHTDTIRGYLLKNRTKIRRFKGGLLFNPETGNYDDDVIAMATVAVVDWFLTNTGAPIRKAEDTLKNLGLTEHDIHPDDYLSIITGIPLGFAADRISVGIQRMLDLELNEDSAPKDVQGIMDGFAKEIITSLASPTIQLLEIKEIPITRLKNPEDPSEGTIKTTVKVIDVHNDNLQKIKDKVSWANNAGTKTTSREVLFRDRQETYSIGKTIDTVPVTHSKSNLPLTWLEKLVLKREQDTPYRVNPILAKLFTDMGDNFLLRIMGHHGDLRKVKNPVVRNTRQGQNLTIESELKEVMDFIQATEGRWDAPIFFPYGVAGNGRHFMQGPSTQRNKLLRILVTPTWSRLDINNKEDMDRFWLNVGQASEIKGINKTEKLNQQEIIDKAEEVFMDKYGLDVLLMQKMLEGRELEEGQADIFVENRSRKNTPDELSAESYLDKIKSPDDWGPAEPLDQVQTLSAIVAVAQLKEAQRKGESHIEISLSYESDGVSNGPINMLILFGQGLIDRVTYENMKRGGLFWGSPEETLNEYYTQDGAVDYYGVMARDGEDNLLDTKGLPGWKVAQREAATRLAANLGDLEIVDGEYRISRDLAKESANPLTYGGGLASISRAVSKKILFNFYVAVEESNRLDVDIKEVTYPEIRADMKTLGLDPVLRKEAEEAKKEAEESKLQDEVTYELDNAIPVFDTRKDNYKPAERAKPQPFRLEDNYLFNKEMREKFDERIMHTVGKAIFNATQKNIGSDSIGFKDLLVLASEVQNTYLKKAYEAEKILLAQRLHKEGVIKKPYESFIPYKYLRKLEKQYNIMSPTYTSDEQNLRIGGFRNSKGKIKLSNNFDLDMLTEHYTRLPGDVGVSALAHLIQGGGDAMIMNFFFGQEKVESDVMNIWDGADMPTAKIHEYGDSLNRAVLKTWRRDLMGMITNSFSDFLEGQYGAIDKELLSKVYAEIYDKRDSTANALPLSVEKLLEEMQKATEAHKARNDIMGLTGLDVHQMGGGRKGHKQEGPILNLAQLNHLIQRRMDGESLESIAKSLGIEPKAQTDFLGDLDIKAKDKWDRVIKRTKARINEIVAGSGNRNEAQKKAAAKEMAGLQNLLSTMEKRLIPVWEAESALKKIMDSKVTEVDENIVEESTEEVKRDTGQDSADVIATEVRGVLKKIEGAINKEKRTKKRVAKYDLVDIQSTLKVTLDDIGEGDFDTEVIRRVLKKIKSNLPEIFEKAPKKSKTLKQEAEEVIKEIEATKPVDLFMGIEDLTDLRLPSFLKGIKFTPEQKKILALFSSELTNNTRIVQGTLEEVQKWMYEKIPDSIPAIDLGKVNAAYDVDNDVMFIINKRPQSILHEVAHIATFKKVLSHYLGKPQKAVERMERLMEEFLEMDDKTAAVVKAQNAIRKHWGLEDPVQRAAAVNEFMAYALTDHRVRRKLKKKNPVSQLTDKVIRLMQFLMGVKAKDFFTQVAFNTKIIIDPSLESNGVPFDWNVTRGGNGSGGKRTNVELAETADNFIDYWTDKWMKYLQSLYDQKNQQRGREQISSGVKETLNADDIMDELNNYAFLQSNEQKRVFRSIYAIVKSTMTLNFTELHRMTRLYQYVESVMTAEMFGEGDVAKAEYETVLKAMEGSDATAIAVLLALSQSSAKFRKVLDQIQPAESNEIDQQTNTVFSKLTQRYMTNYTSTITKDTPLDILDGLQDSLIQSQKDAEFALLATLATPINFIDTMIRNKFESWAAGMRTRDEKIQNDAKASRMEKITTQFTLLTNLLDDEGYDATLKAIQAGVHSLVTHPSVVAIAEFVDEIVGTNSVNSTVITMFDIVKDKVAGSRQALREDLPVLLSKSFKEPPTPTQWRAMQKTLANTDISRLIGANNVKLIMEIVRDKTKRDEFIEIAEKQLRDALNPKDWVLVKEKSQQLAQFMNTGRPGILLARNAEAIYLMSEQGKLDNKALNAQLTKNIDILVTAYAIDTMDATARSETVKLWDTDPKGIVQVLALLTELNRQEEEKKPARHVVLQSYKGFISNVGKDNYRIKIDKVSKERELVNRGYKKVGPVNDTLEGSYSLAYYVTTTPEKGIYTQGAMQNVASTFKGVDKNASRTVTDNATDFIYDKETVQEVTEYLQGLKQGQYNEADTWLPIFATDGNIWAYERSINPDITDVHLGREQNLAINLGAWAGRQEEERLAYEYNIALVDELHDIYEDRKATDRRLFVNIKTSRDPLHREAYKLIPTEIREYMDKKFDKEGPMILRSMVNISVGYREFSMADFWTGNTRMPKIMQQVVKKLTDIQLFGFGGRTGILYGERGLHAAVSEAKDWILIRSMVVLVANTLSNVIQLSVNNVPMRVILKSWIQKIKELAVYRTNKIKLIELNNLKLITTDKDELKRLNKRIQVIKDLNAKMSIHSMIEHGQLKQLSEGLTEFDRDSASKGLVGYMEEQASKLPKGITGIAKVALISRSTKWYKFANEATQASDFIAKSIYNDWLLAQGEDEGRALELTNEEFVNFSFLPGRLRSALERNGLQWFYAFKIRIMKVANKQMRKNPFRALVMNLSVDGGTPIQDNVVPVLLDGDRLDNSLGFDMLFGAPEMNPWLNIMNGDGY